MPLKPQSKTGGRDYDPGWPPLFAEESGSSELAVKFRLPATYPLKGFFDEGGLMSYRALR